MPKLLLLIAAFYLAACAQAQINPASVDSLSRSIYKAAKARRLAHDSAIKTIDSKAAQQDLRKNIKLTAATGKQEDGWYSGGRILAVLVITTLMMLLYFLIKSQGRGTN